MGHPPIFLAMWVIEGRITLKQAEWIWNSLRGQEVPHDVGALVRQLEGMISLAKRECPE